MKTGLYKIALIVPDIVNSYIACMRIGIRNVAVNSLRNSDLTDRPDPDPHPTDQCPPSRRSAEG